MCLRPCLEGPPGGLAGGGVRGDVAQDRGLRPASATTRARTAARSGSEISMPATRRTARASNSTRPWEIASHFASQTDSPPCFPERNRVCWLPVPATWPVLTTGVILAEPAATSMVAAGSVFFCSSSPADAGACGVAFRVSMASHFALQFGTPPCPASPGIGSPLPPSDCEQTDGIWGIYQQHYDLDPRQPRPDDTQWTGAEIKSCCRLASLLDVPLIQAARNVVPVAVTAGDKIEGLRQWASGRCLSADRAGVYSRAVVGSGRQWSGAEGGAGAGGELSSLSCGHRKTPGRAPMRYPARL